MALLEVKNVSKSFAGVKALNSVNFDLKKGEIHALIGENGAGKSTLMKIISGVYQQDKGQIFIDGQLVKIRNPKDAIDRGIIMIHQELQLCPYLTVSENILMGHLPETRLSFIDWEEANKRAKVFLDRLGLDLSPSIPVGQLSVAQKQMIEIAKAISRNVKIILMDEPTAALTPAEIKNFFELIRQLQAEGISIVYISHKLDEVIEIAERVTVLRDGVLIKTLPTKETSISELTELMIGRSVEEFFGEEEKSTQEQAASHKVVLAVKNLSRKGVLKNISFELIEGEILGIYGLMGSGRTELLRAIYGADSIDSGEIYLNLSEISINSPADAIEHGISLIPEERRLQGLFLDLPVRHNTTISSLKYICRSSIFIDEKQEVDLVNHYIIAMSVKTDSMEKHVRYLSGGNQQKVVISRSLASRSKILLLDEPTRGIDVGSKSEIYALIRSLAKEGYSIILVSSELPEIVKLSHRVLVINKGEIVAQLDRCEVNASRIADIIAEHIDAVSH
jgi:ribose transport system ATP-binding protein